jgi:hypothetical protein
MRHSFQSPITRPAGRRLKRWNPHASSTRWRGGAPRPGRRPDWARGAGSREWPHPGTDRGLRERRAAGRGRGLRAGYPARGAQRSGRELPDPGGARWDAGARRELPGVRPEDRHRGRGRGGGCRLAGLEPRARGDRDRGRGGGGLGGGGTGVGRRGDRLPARGRAGGQRHLLGGDQPDSGLERRRCRTASLRHIARGRQVRLRPRARRALLHGPPRRQPAPDSRAREAGAAAGPLPRELRGEPVHGEVLHRRPTGRLRRGPGRHPDEGHPRRGVSSPEHERRLQHESRRRRFPDVRGR